LPLALVSETHADSASERRTHDEEGTRATVGGLLTIQEGDAQEKRVVLDVNLLRTGAVVYRPVHGDVLFRIVILGQGGTKLEESATTFPGRISAIGSDHF
jgi:hypothetical protein